VPAAITDKPPPSREISFVVLASVGIRRTAVELLAMGRRIYDERIRLRERLGFRVSAGDVPRRFYETPTPRGQLRPERVANMLAIYEQKRGQG